MQHFKPTSLKKLVKKPFVNNKINPTPVITSSKPTPVVVPTPLSPAQKAAALPFVQEPVKKSKSKAIGRFFKKFTKLPLDNKKQQHKITFVPIPPQESLSSDCNNNNNNNNNNKNTQVTSTTPQITTQEQQQPDSIASDYAQRIWDEDKTVYANIENVAEWIGNGKPMSNMILTSYMNKFDFKSLKLEQAFRVLCSKLHLKAETQQIDRILAAFAGRYYDCNPKCIFGTSDIVHTLVYSMLLLNTDLHVAQGDYKKMSRVAFVKNTMYAITSQIEGCSPEFEQEQRKSTSLQSFDWIPLQRTSSNQSASSTASSMSYDASALVFGSKAWQTQLKMILKQIHNGIRGTQVATPSTPISASNSMGAAIRRSIGSIMRRDSSYTISSQSSIATSFSRGSSIFFSATGYGSENCFPASTRTSICVY
ncbi:SEC7-like protein [Backusella circina FSU 941]|nr:SEC7-like protein [Backusella circina FSU 941]